LLKYALRPKIAKKSLNTCCFRF